MGGVGALRADPRAGVLGLVCAAAGVAAAAVVRTAGRKLEVELWASWGGPPAQRRLRWVGASHRESVERLHARVGRVLDEQLPTEYEEQADSDAAYRSYDQAVRSLIVRTRDPKRFPLVADQNADYGFRRNCLGIRRTAQLVAVVTFVLAVALAFATHDWGRWLPGIASSAVGLWFWSVVVNREWVREAAELYADRLFEGAEELGADVSR